MDLEGHLIGGQYDVKRRLQSGYFGVTWLALNRATNTDVCIKTFFSESQSQRKELVILKQLCEGHFNHDYVCKVLDVSTNRAPVVAPSGCVVSHIQYVVFEYCSGSDLFNFLCTGPWEKTQKVSSFSEPIARHYFKQIVLGLMYLHERGMFHRDIKPENCVLDSNLTLKLTDFGTNKYFSGNDPMQLLRTKTRGVGTESYRAPEVNSGRSYDPASADVWSLGMTLFFFVGVEQMFSKAQSLDSYSKQLLAPLGIYFPFPLHCSKLDSYLRREHELRCRGVTGSVLSSSLPNETFWAEWQNLREGISPELVDLFNRIFVLEPALRITLRDVLRHQWMNVPDGLSPEAVKAEIERRCPSSIRMSRNASPVVLRSTMLGGVDQGVLRETLSGANREGIEFPEDSQTWRWSLQVQHLESIILLIAGGDIQELVMDLQLTRDLLNDILLHPDFEDNRSVLLDHVNTEWITQLFLVLGFLPQGHQLVLVDEYLDLSLLCCAIVFLQGVELAISRSAIYTTCGDDNGMEEVMDMEETTFEDEVDTGEIPLPHVPNGPGLEEPPASLQIPPNGFNRSISGGEQSMGTPMGSSQGSRWTASMSTQSSQDEVPESLQLIHDWSRDFTGEHDMIPLSALLKVRTPKQFQAASEFCKMSGLLCSYGLYQVVCNDQLAVYCKGNTTYFSMRIVYTVEQEQYKACISTWCFAGPEEWQLVLEKLKKDMTQ